MNMEDRIAILEKKMALAEMNLVQGVSTSTADAASSLALASIVQELAARMGLSAEQFKKAYQQRRDYWQQRFLESVENFDAGLAAQVDRRDKTRDASGVKYPPLFPEED